MSIKGQGHYLTLPKGHSDFKIKSCFSQKLLSHLEPNFLWKLMGEWEWKFIQMNRVTWPRWSPCPYMVKTFKNLFQNRILPFLTFHACGDLIYVISIATVPPYVYIWMQLLKIFMSHWGKLYCSVTSLVLKVSLLTNNFFFFLLF